MRPILKNYLKHLSETIDFPEPILEIGSFLVKGQEELANLRPLFPGKEYIGSDMRAGPGVDLLLDIENAGMFTSLFGSIIFADTLEHIKHPFTAIQEAYRILRPGGLIFIASVFYFPIHNYPDDYWRFTPHAFRLLLSDFQNVKISYNGHPLLPTGVYGYGFK